MSELLEIRRPVLNELEYLHTMGSKLFLCPFVGRSSLYLCGFCVLNILVIITTTQLFLTLCNTDFRDWFELINVAPNLGVCAVSTIKYTKFYTNGVLYDQIFCHYRDDLWEVISVKSKTHVMILKKYKFFAMVLNRFLFYYSFLLVVVVNSFPYLVMLYKNRVLGKELEYLYPFDGWYPFDKVKWYWSAYTWESCMTTLVVFIYGYSSIVHATYVLFICMELKILGNNLEEIIRPEDVKNMKHGARSDEIHQRVLLQLKNIIARHHLLAKISASLDNVLGDAMLLNYSLGAVLICLTAFTFTMVNNFYLAVRYFFFFMSLLVESFILCLGGQIISDHSEDLTESIYSADWPNASPQVKQIMLMFMMRTQKPFIFTAKGYVVMNLNTFCAICSTSYQFFNLLRTVYP